MTARIPGYLNLIRFDREQYTWRSGSSQLLRRRLLMVGSNCFHVGVLAILAGHFVGLLTPHEIGLYSVSMALISMAQVVRDFGLANYLIQKKDLGREDVGSALGLSILLGAGLFLLINLAAPWIADFYREPSLVNIIRIISVNFLILPFNSISISLLRRDMRFDALMRINVCAAVTSCFTTLGAAWVGAGSVSLALGEIASSLTMAVGVSLAGAWGRLPMPQLQRWRQIVGFGGPVTAANVVTSISMDMNDLAVGKILDFSQVAIASRAQGLMNLFARDVMGTSPKTTEKDTMAVDALLKARLASPDIGWLSEETEDNDARLTRPYVFVVDPIDGTRAFARGDADWTIAIGIVGVLIDVVLRQIETRVSRRSPAA